MEDQTPPTASNDHSLVVPAFGKALEIRMDMSRIREAETRIIEAKTVNPSTYAELEYSYNEAYRDLKRYISILGYQIAMAEKALEAAKADVLLDTYPKYLEEKAIKKTQDNADLRKAFLSRDEKYNAALDRFNQLKALESNFDGKIKVFERTCAYMKKQMDLILRSGLSGRDLYPTSGRKNG